MSYHVGFDPDNLHHIIALTILGIPKENLRINSHYDIYWNIDEKNSKFFIDIVKLHNKMIIRHHNDNIEDDNERESIKENFKLGHGLTFVCNTDDPTIRIAVDLLHPQSLISAKDIVKQIRKLERKDKSCQSLNLKTLTN